MSGDGQSRETRPGASELKFVVDRLVGERVIEWARARLPRDAYGGGACGDEYRISSLYFDTEAYDVLLARGSFGRSKYRVRRYGASDVVYLERKLRKPGLLHKRRTMTPIVEIGRLAGETPEESWSGQWFHRRLIKRQLRPTCELTYMRVARVMQTADTLLRLTIDAGIFARPVDGYRFGNGEQVAVLDRQQVIELKFRGDLPPLFKLLMESFALDPVSSSKYRLGMTALGQAQAARPLARV
jgi:hypothetical protein